MSEQNQETAVQESPKAAPAAPEAGDKEMWASIYEAMAADADETEEPEAETTEKGPEEDEKVAAKGKKDEPAKKTEPEETKKPTDEEIAEAMAAIETEKKAIAEQKRELVKSFGKLKSQEEKIKKLSATEAREKQVLQQEREQFQAEKRVWLEDVKQLMTGPVETKIQLLKKIAGELDIVDAVKTFNETTAGVGTTERLLQSELAEIKKMLAQRDEAHKQQLEAEEKAKREAAEREQFERELHEGDALVRNNIGQLVANASAFRFPAIAELTELLGPQATATYMYNIGEKMAEQGYRIPYAKAALAIAQEVTHFVTNHPKGIEWLDGLRKSKPAPQSAATTVTGTRHETPGSSLSAAATSAPGPRRSDLPQTEDALSELKLMSSRDFALRHLPAGLVD